MWEVFWFHQLADGLKNHTKFGIVLLLQGFEFLRQVLVGRQQVSEFHEGTHDGDVDLDGPLVSRNMKSSGKRSMFLVTALLRFPVVTP